MPEAMRDVVRRTVAERIPIDDVETDEIVEFLAHYDALTDPFDEHADPVHVTGSAIVVGPRGVVLLEHRRLGIWLQPGGHVERDESPWDAAVREAREETGLDVRLIGDEPRLVHVDVHAGGRGHTHLDLRYLCDGGEADPDPPEGESQQVGWFDWADAIARVGDDRLRTALEALRPAR